MNEMWLLTVTVKHDGSRRDLRAEALGDEYWGFARGPFASEAAARTYAEAFGMEDFEVRRVI